MPQARPVVGRTVMRTPPPPPPLAVAVAVEVEVVGRYQRRQRGRWRQRRGGVERVRLHFRLLVLARWCLPGSLIAGLEKLRRTVGAPGGGVRSLLWGPLLRGLSSDPGYPGVVGAGVPIGFWRLRLAR